MMTSATDPLTGPPPWAVALHQPADAAPLADALRRVGLEPTLVTDAGAAFAAVVRGAAVLVVDTAVTGATELLEGTRRRIDDGWSNCAVVAYHPPDSAVDVDLSPYLDAVARYPIATSSLELAIRVAFTQRNDRTPAR
jgi:hypothetical protein